MILQDLYNKSLQHAQAQHGLVSLVSAKSSITAYQNRTDFRTHKYDLHDCRTVQISMSAAKMLDAKRPTNSTSVISESMASSISKSLKRKRIRNPANFCCWNPESRDWNPESTMVLESGIQKVGIRNLEAGIRNPGPSWILLHGATSGYIYKLLRPV